MSVVMEGGKQSKISNSERSSASKPFWRARREIEVEVNG